MSNLSDVKGGIKTVVEAAITDLRVYSYPDDGALEYPCLVIQPTGELEYATTIDAGTLETTLTATLYLQHGQSDKGWEEVDKYRSFGSGSIKAAIETDRTLNGTADDSFVMSSSDAIRARDDRDQFWVFTCEFNVLVIKGGL